MRMSSTDTHKAKERSVGGGGVFNILIRLDPATTDSYWFPQTHTHTNISINSLHVTLTPRLVNMVAIFVAAASSSAVANNNNSNKNNYSGKLKRKNHNY